MPLEELAYSSRCQEPACETVPRRTAAKLGSSAHTSAAAAVPLNLVCRHTPSYLQVARTSLAGYIFMYTNLVLGDAALPLTSAFHKTHLGAVWASEANLEPKCFLKKCAKPSVAQNMLYY